MDSGFSGELSLKRILSFIRHPQTDKPSLKLAQCFLNNTVLISTSQRIFSITIDNGSLVIGKEYNHCVTPVLSVPLLRGVTNFAVGPYWCMGSIFELTVKAS